MKSEQGCFIMELRYVSHGVILDCGLTTKASEYLTHYINSNLPTIMAGLTSMDYA